jgi:hypothetical protein
MELVLAYRMRLILSAPGAELQLMDQDAWARTGRYDAVDVHGSSKLFGSLRASNLTFLGTLSGTEWATCGIHPERGAESILDMAKYYAGHDINHLRQIEAILGNAQADEDESRGAV